MDHMCIRTVKVKQLETAAKLSAVQLVECDEYIRLAMYVEQYIANPCDALFDDIKEQLAICTKQFPTFNQSRQSLIATLLHIGYMTKEKVVTEPDKSPKKQPEEIKSINTTKPDNVYNIFTKKKIDIPE
jgi:hypothetical protein